MRILLPLTLIMLLSAATIFAEDPEESSVEERIANRTFPSVFQAWDPADNLKKDGTWKAVARHDLFWHIPYTFGLIWDLWPDYGLATDLTPDSIDDAVALREKLLKMNPNIILLAAITYRDADLNFLPEDHPWWLRDENGDLVLGYESGSYKAYLLDISNPRFRKQIAVRARALVRSGAVDGIFLDWWDDDGARVKLARKIRKLIGKEALIVGNVNTRKIPKTARYVNGIFMECCDAVTADDWAKMEDTLVWAQSNLREPRITCLNTWYQNAGDEEAVMRAITTLSLTRSDGYSLFSNYKKVHHHDWYPFLDKSLGKPTAPGVLNADGSWSRQFENGVAVYNPIGNAKVTVRLKSKHKSMATNKRSKKHGIGPLDGDILIDTKK